MAYKNLKTAKFNLTNEIGERFEASLPIQIDTETGKFRIKLPEELKNVAKKLGYKIQFAHGTQMKFDYIYADSLKDAESAIINSIKDYLKCTTIKDIVIAYTYKNFTSYYKDSKGVIRPNGKDLDDDYDKDFNNGGRWHCAENKSSSEEQPSMSVSIAVSVLARTRFVRPSGTSAKYEAYCFREQEVENELHSPKLFNSEYAEYLDRFHCHASFAKELSDYHKTDINAKTFDIEVIPYSDEAAKFFADVLLGMCKLADKFNMFFERDKEEIIKSIESRNTNLLTWGK